MNVKGHTVIGAAVGWLVGGSTGVAAMGTAVNGAFIFGPLGALVGWLIARAYGTKAKGETTSTAVRTTEVEEHDSRQEVNSITSRNPFVDAAIEFLAILWIIHLEILRMCWILPLFLHRPWLFTVLAFAASMIFPPFFLIYLACAAAASHLGMSAATEYRALI